MTVFCYIWYLTSYICMQTYHCKHWSSSLLLPDSLLSSLELTADELTDSSASINIYEPPSINIIIMGSVQFNGELSLFPCLELNTKIKFDQLTASRSIYGCKCVRTYSAIKYVVFFSVGPVRSELELRARTKSMYVMWVKQYGLTIETAETTVAITANTTTIECE